MRKKTFVRQYLGNGIKKPWVLNKGWTFYAFLCIEKHESGLNQLQESSAGILKQSVGARNRVGIGVVVPARQATLAGGIVSLESIPGLLNSLKIPSLKGMLFSRL